MNRRNIKRKAVNKSLALISYLVVAFLYVPFAILIVFSFNNQRSNTEWIGFTTKWYMEILKDSSLWEVIRSTLITGIGSTFLAVVIGTTGAVGLTRFKFKGRNFLSNVMYVPMVIPEIVLAVALLSIFVLLDLPTGLTAVILGHTALALPFVYINVKTALGEFDKSIEEASMDLGANRKQTFFRITMPIIMPGIMSGAFLAFSLSLDDLIISSFLGGAGVTTLPVLIYSQVKIGISPEINVIYTIIIAIIFIALLIKRALRRSRK